MRYASGVSATVDCRARYHPAIVAGRARRIVATVGGRSRGDAARSRPFHADAPANPRESVEYLEGFVPGEFNCGGSHRQWRAVRPQGFDGSVEHVTNWLFSHGDGSRNRSLCEGAHKRSQSQGPWPEPRSVETCGGRTRYDEA